MAAIAAFVIRFPSASGRCPGGTARLSDSEKMLNMLARRPPAGWGFAVIATKSPVLRSAGVARSVGVTRVEGVISRVVPSASTSLVDVALCTAPSILVAAPADHAGDAAAAVAVG